VIVLWQIDNLESSLVGEKFRPLGLRPLQASFENGRSRIRRKTKYPGSGSPAVPCGRELFGEIMDKNNRLVKARNVLIQHLRGELFEACIFVYKTTLVLRASRLT
jgi:hypothetical protein